MKTPVRLLLCLGLLAAFAKGQIPEPPEPPEEVKPPAVGVGPKSPRELMTEFRKRIQTYASTKADEDLERAGELFDFTDIPTTDRSGLGAQAAYDLAVFLNHDYIPAFNVSRQKKEPSPLRLDLEHGTLELVRGEDTVWRFARRTLEEVSLLQAMVQELEPHPKAIELPVRSGTVTFIRDLMPLGWRTRSFLLENWQWLGLFGLIVLGLLVELVISWLVTGVIALRFRRHRVQVRPSGRRPGRPVGMLAMAAVWLGGLQFLLLPAGAHVIVMMAARIMMMVAAVQAVWRFVDVVGDLLQAKATLTQSKLDDQLVPMFRRAVKIFVGIAGILWIAHSFDLNLKALLAGLGLGGLAFALAAKDTVNNLFGSLTILLDRPFHIGDWIVMGDIEGTVELVGFRSCRVRTFYNSLITFPNALLITASVDNMGQRRYRRIKEMLGVTYDTPPAKLEAFTEGIRELIRKHPYTRKDYFHVYVNKMSTSSIDVMLYTFVECPDWATELREKQRLLVDILRLAQELGVEFAFPTQSIHLVKELPDHADAPANPDAALEQGRRKARDIVSRFTGADIPPPVTIMPGQDESAEGDEEE